MKRLLEIWKFRFWSFKGDSYAQSIYENILNQEKFLKSLNDVVKAVQREGGVRDKKAIKLRTLLSETDKSSNKDFSNLVNFEAQIPLILDPDVKVKGVNAEMANIFKSSLMPSKFVFKAQYPSGEFGEYTTIYKIGDDLRQDQLIVQMIALMDKVIISLILITKIYQFLNYFSFLSFWNKRIWI